MTTELLARTRLAAQTCQEQGFSHTAEAFNEILEDLLRGMVPEVDRPPEPPTAEVLAFRPRPRIRGAGRPAQADRAVAGHLRLVAG